MPEQGGQNTAARRALAAGRALLRRAGGDDVNPEATMNPTDGSFGDPGVRISQFVNAFQDSVLARSATPATRSSMTAIATKLGQLVTPPCITQTIQNGLGRRPDVHGHRERDDNSVKKNTAILNCDDNNNTAPCWTLSLRDGELHRSDTRVNDLPGTNARARAPRSTARSACRGRRALPGCFGVWRRIFLPAIPVALRVSRREP